MPGCLCGFIRLFKNMVKYFKVGDILKNRICFRRYCKLLPVQLQSGTVLSFQHRASLSMTELRKFSFVTELATDHRNTASILSFLHIVSENRNSVILHLHYDACFLQHITGVYLGKIKWNRKTCPTSLYPSLSSSSSSGCIS